MICRKLHRRRDEQVLRRQHLDVQRLGVAGKRFGVIGCAQSEAQRPVARLAIRRRRHGQLAAHRRVRLPAAGGVVVASYRLGAPSLRLAGRVEPLPANGVVSTRLIPRLPPQIRVQQRAGGSGPAVRIDLQQFDAWRGYQRRCRRAGHGRRCQIVNVQRDGGPAAGRRAGRVQQIQRLDRAFAVLCVYAKTQGVATRRRAWRGGDIHPAEDGLAGLPAKSRVIVRAETSVLRRAPGIAVIVEQCGGELQIVVEWLLGLPEEVKRAEQAIASRLAGRPAVAQQADLSAEVRIQRNVRGQRVRKGRPRFKQKVAHLVETPEAGLAGLLHSGPFQQESGHAGWVDHIFLPLHQPRTALAGQSVSQRRRRARTVQYCIDVQNFQFRQSHRFNFGRVIAPGRRSVAADQHHRLVGLNT